MTPQRFIGGVLVAATATTLLACATPPGRATSRLDTSGDRGACLVGTYDVVSVEAPDLLGLGIAATATGGSMRISFDRAGSWTLVDDGSRASRVEAGPLDAQFTANGRVTGRLTRLGDRWELRHRTATGVATLTLPVAGPTTFEFDDVAPTIMPDGVVDIECERSSVTLTSVDDDIVMRLEPAR